MRRLKTASPSAEAAKMAEWAGTGPAEPRKARRGPRNPQAMSRAVEAARERQENGGDWSGASAAEVVGLYAVLHEHIYGVLPEELADVWMGAAAAAGRMLRDDFEGDPNAMVDYLRWTWHRERGREKRRAAGDSSRIGWRLQFAARNLVTDYRVDEKRHRRSTAAKGAR